MDLTDRRILVTGGAGFVGSHLCERLVADNAVRVVDDCSNGDADWLPDGVEFVEGDLRDASVAEDAITPDLDIVFHFAADRTIAGGGVEQFRLNNALTERVVERMDEVGVRNVAFTSSSTVYGEAPRPTPEDYAPLEPISPYGASKLAEESLLSVYAHSHDFTVWAYRFANIVGPRLQAGAVVPDFIEKLRDVPERLEILGDGRQEKSYMHVSECVDAMVHVVENTDEPTNCYNLGTRTTISVTRIAELVSDVVGCDPEFEYTGGDRGWTGDVPKMRLSIEKVGATGWSPEMESAEAVQTAAEQLYEELR